MSSPSRSHTDTPLVERRKAVYAWANGDPLLLSARCAKAEEKADALLADLERLEEALVEIEALLEPSRKLGQRARALVIARAALHREPQP